MRRGRYGKLSSRQSDDDLVVVATDTDHPRPIRADCSTNAANVSGATETTNIATRAVTAARTDALAHTGRAAAEWPRRLQHPGSMPTPRRRWPSRGRTGHWLPGQPPGCRGRWRACERRDRRRAPQTPELEPDPEGTR